MMTIVETIISVRFALLTAAKFPKRNSFTPACWFVEFHSTPMAKNEASTMPSAASDFSRVDFTTALTTAIPNSPAVIAKKKITQGFLSSLIMNPATTPGKTA
eukprot:Seg22206.1 transcript_id=Seg22206.1/GoldUCD/mRNA.D3Y31 product="hypothetical protein" protein_id=Seg22206.1/GoldUCD/D3Y31